jgi:proteasome accessory factor C
MSGVAIYAQRMATLPAALAALELHPDGLSMTNLARELGITTEKLRETLLAYYLVDLSELGDFTMPVIEFIGVTEDEDVDPATAQRVRVSVPDPERELGVEHLSAEQLGRLYQAGADLLALEPANEVLRSALEAFQTALWQVEGPSGAGWKSKTAQQMHVAVQERRRVRITYARQWRAGTSERAIEPYRVVRTRRGWEVDAGPADDISPVRTFLVSGIVEGEVLDETFERPSDVDALVAAHRQPLTVELVVPQSARWAVDRYAESVTVVRDDETDVAVRADLLPPAEQRLGLILLCCGPYAFVMDPSTLENAGVDLARELLAHHQTR